MPVPRRGRLLDHCGPQSVLLALLVISGCRRGAVADSAPASPTTAVADGGTSQGAGSPSKAGAVTGGGGAITGGGAVNAINSLAGALGIEAGQLAGPTPYTLFMNEAIGAIMMGAVAVDTTHVYWGENGGDLMRRSLDGASKAERFGKWEETLLGIQLALDQEYVYWVDGYAWVRAPKAGGTPIRVSLEAPGGDVAADARYAYAAALGCALIVRAAHGTVATETLYPPAPIQSSPGLTYLQIDGSDVYCAAGRYVFVSHDWGPMQELTSSMNKVVGVVVVNGELYWLDVVHRSHSTLYRRAQDGQAVAVGTVDNSGPNRPIADPGRKRILFTTGGAVLSMSTETGAWKILTLSTFPGTGSARDDNYFYWGRATSSYASIERMALTQE